MLVVITYNWSPRTRDSEAVLLIRRGIITLLV